MSEVYHGVLIKTDEANARQQFGALQSDNLPQLASLKGDVFGYYYKKGEGTFEELQTIATRLSQAAGVAVLYFYDSRVGFVFEIYENGQLKQSNNHDDDVVINPFKALAAPDVRDEDVEAAFRWDRGEVLIED